VLHGKIMKPLSSINLKVYHLKSTFEATFYKCHQTYVIISLYCDLAPAYHEGIRFDRSKTIHSKLIEICSETGGPYERKRPVFDHNLLGKSSLKV